MVEGDGLDGSATKVAYEEYEVYGDYEDKL